MDRLHGGSRRYRLLDCDISYHRRLPREGDSLAFGIRARSLPPVGGNRLVEFSYDCLVEDGPSLTLRRGLAGYFTSAELTAAVGIPSKPTRSALPEGHHRDLGCCSAQTAWERADIEAHEHGRATSCFGDRWTDSDGFAGWIGRLGWLDSITDFDPEGGAYARGFARGHIELRADSWFFGSHFVDDPCMPGTFVLDAAFQLAGFYLGAVGAGTRSSHRGSEPFRDASIRLRCRRQVTPECRSLTYDMHVVCLSDRDGGQGLVVDIVVWVDDTPAVSIDNLAIRPLQAPA
jgi:3-hydroxymyristoyl/3-hydroxydecanoyl-(acyl carrier protein) dehydratase